MRIDFLVVVLKFRATGDLHFENWKAANLFRGVFGISLRNACCAVECPGPATCEERGICAYSRLFEPTEEGGPSGLHNRPRPFVIQSAALNGLRVERGGEFTLRVYLFEQADVVEVVASAFRHMDRAELTDWTLESEVAEHEAEPCERLTVDFLSPMELKWQDRVLREPHFPALLGRARDRVAGLASGGADWDFKRLGDLAERVRMTDCDVRIVDVERRSSRTGQQHGLGGFVGTASYIGDLGELLPILQLAQWTGVGRHTAWGNGAIQVRGFPTGMSR